MVKSKLTAVVFSMIAIVTLILVIALNNRETKAKQSF